MTIRDRPIPRSLPLPRSRRAPRMPVPDLIPRTLKAASWLSPTRWTEQITRTELAWGPESPVNAPSIGELDLPPDTVHHRIDTDDGGTIHAVELGSGPPIVLLHGVLLSVATWPYQLRELSKDHRVIAIDQRGHGRSTAGEEGFSIQRLGRDLAKVLEALKIRNAIVVGHSMGGMVIMHQAGHHYEEFSSRVSGVVLVATAADPLFNIPGLATFIKIAGPWFRLGIEILRGRDALANWRPLTYVCARVILGRQPSPSNVEFSKALIGAASARILGELWGQLMQFSELDNLRHVEIPAKVVAGDSDLLTPPWHAIRIVQHMPNATLVRFAECGHMIMFERHKELNRIISTFASTCQASEDGTVAKRRISRSKDAPHAEASSAASASGSSTRDTSGPGTHAPASPKGRGPAKGGSGDKS